MIIFISMTSFILEGWICYIIQIGTSYQSLTIQKKNPSIEFGFEFSAQIGLNVSQ